MASISKVKSSSSVVPSPGQSLCVIVGLACLAGFLVDVAILSLPLNVFSLQWRINVLQQVGDRSIILLFGFSLLIYGFLDIYRLRKNIALLCLSLGVMFSLSGVLIIRDSLKFKDMTLANITNQQAQVQTQIENAQANPSELAPELTLETLQQASQLLDERAETIKQNAKASVIKVGVSGVGNLIIVGISLIGVGRLGSRINS